MPDWERYVEERVREAARDDTARVRVTQELAEMLGALEREAIAAGASPDEARAQALAQVPDWSELMKRIDDADASAGRRPQRSALRLTCSAGNGRKFISRTLLQGDGFLFGELRLGWRRLTRAPGFLAAGTLLLGVGIGFASAIFGAIDAVLLDPFVPR